MQSTEGQRLTKVDRENEVAPPPKIDLSVGKAMAQARQAKEPAMSQKVYYYLASRRFSIVKGWMLMSDVGSRHQGQREAVRD